MEDAGPKRKRGRDGPLEDQRGRAVAVKRRRPDSRPGRRAVDLAERQIAEQSVTTPGPLSTGTTAGTAATLSISSLPPKSTSPALDSQDQFHPPPLLLCSAVVAVPNTGVFIIGGTNTNAPSYNGTSAAAASDSSPAAQSGNPASCLPTMFLYSPETDVWITNLPAMPTGLCNHTATLWGNSIWVVGGSRVVANQNIGIQDLNPSIYVYDLFSKSWSDRNSTLPPRFNHIALLYNATNSLYIHGGQSQYYTLLNDLVVLHLDQVSGGNVTTEMIVDSGVYGAPTTRTMASAVQLQGVVPGVSAAVSTVPASLPLDALAASAAVPAPLPFVGFVYGGLTVKNSALQSTLSPLTGEKSWFAFDLQTGVDISKNSSVFAFANYQFPPPTNTTSGLAGPTALPITVTGSNAVSPTLTSTTTTTISTQLTTTMAAVPPFPTSDPALDGPTFNSSDSSGNVVANFAFVTNPTGTLAWLYGGGIPSAASDAMWLLNATDPTAWTWARINPSSKSGLGDGGSFPAAAYVSGAYYGGLIFWFLPWDGATSNGGIIVYDPIANQYVKKNSTLSAEVTQSVTPPTSTSSDSTSGGALAVPPPAVFGIVVACLAVACGALLAVWFAVGRRRGFKVGEMRFGRRKGSSTGSGMPGSAAGVDPAAQRIPRVTITDSSVHDGGSDDGEMIPMGEMATPAEAAVVRADSMAGDRTPSVVRSRAPSANRAGLPPSSASTPPIPIAIPV
ncbi:hypothetical protein HK101_003733, partial [Irineochytrium annulatum]